MYAKDTLQAFRKWFLEKTLLKNFGLIKEQNIGGILKKILQGEIH